MSVYDETSVNTRKILTVAPPKKGAKPAPAKKKPASIDDESEEDWG
jgi:hypothetical protein